MASRYPVLRERFTGPVRLDHSELDVRYGEGRTIFLEHMHDIGSPGVTLWMLFDILYHAMAWPKNQYVMQTKAPWRLVEWMNTNFVSEWMYQIKPIIGTTIESNRVPEAHRRQESVRQLTDFGFTTFITIEPILDFEPLKFSSLILHADPTWVNIGADSKGCRLDEPSPRKVKDLIAILKEQHGTVHIKPNLARILHQPSTHQP